MTNDTQCDFFVAVKKKYSEEELTQLVAGNPEIGDMISEYFVRLFQNSRTDSYRTMLRLILVDIEEIPLFINHEESEIREIANWRLKIAK